MSAEVKKEIQLEIAHVLFIDIVGYSKRLINEQRALLDILNQIVRGTDEFRSAEAAGRLIKIPTGDGMALVFYSSPEAPVECALQMSRALKIHPDLRLRMGVHSGPVSGVVDVNERVNVAGAGINVAQRVMDCGDAGHILLSKRVAEDLEHYGHWQRHLHDLGECEIKHGVRIHVVNLYTQELGNPEVPEKLRQAKETQTAPATAASDAKRPRRSHELIAALIIVAATAAAGSYIFSHRSSSKAPRSSAAPAPSAIPEKSIAVLPFENLSEEKANAYFADGIQDEILTRLSRIADLKVISRTSTQHYKSAPENLPEIARQLGVAHILEGSVQKSGDAVRVNVQLIKAANDSHLWADTFDRKLNDIFSVESEVAAAIAGALQAKLTGGEQQALAVKPTDNPQAYDAYLRALSFEARAVATNPDDYKKAAGFYEEAVRRDPAFALAWAHLSIMYSYMYHVGFDHTPERLAAIQQTAETAVQLQPNQGESYLALANYQYRGRRDYDAALEAFERARALLPNNASILYGIGFVERRQGKWKEALAHFQQAELLDPHDLELFKNYAETYFCFRQFESARRIIDRGLSVVPDNPDLIVDEALSYQAEGKLKEADEVLQPLLLQPGNNTVFDCQMLQLIYTGRYQQAIAALKNALAAPAPALGDQVGDYFVLLADAQLRSGDKAAARATCERGGEVLESLRAKGNDSWYLAATLGLMYAGKGDKAAALREGQRALELVGPDVASRPSVEELFARIESQVGDVDAAISALPHLLQATYLIYPFDMPLTPALLRLDPAWDPLRNDPRFQKLVASPAPNNTKR
jgi:TolB-like protein/class 3 adenylate cyclase/Tfp pilus assembly protein PilF